MTDTPDGWAAPGSGPTPPASPPPSSAPSPSSQEPPGGVPYYGAPQYGAPQYGAPQYGAPQYGAPQYGKAWAPQPGVVPLRPLALGELLDGAIKIVRRHPRPTLGLSAAIAAVVTVLNVALVVALSAGDGLLQTSGTSDATDGTTQSFTANVSSAPGALVGYFAGIFLTGALVAVVGKAVLGQPAPTGEVWRTIRPRLWALLGVSLLSGLLVGAPIFLSIAVAVGLAVIGGPVTLLLGIPLGIAGTLLSVHLYARLSLAPAALVLEKTGVRAALRRSAVLVKGSWWRVFGTLVLTGIITTVIAGILTVPPIIVAGLLSISSDSGDGTGLLVTQQVAAGIASVFLTPFSAGVRALLYVDRRMRAEGLDVSLQAAAAGGDQPA